MVETERQSFSVKTLPPGSTGFFGVQSAKTPIKKANLKANGSEQTLIETVSIGAIEGYVDLSNMTTGDTVILKQYFKLQEDGQYGRYGSQIYIGPQVEPIMRFPLKLSDSGMKVTLQQTAGSFKSFPHAFYKDD